MSASDSRKASSGKTGLPEISIVAPLFNEQAAFQSLVDRLRELIASSSLRMEVVLVDDGSADLTPGLMTELARSDERFQCIFLSRNHGHQIAVTAGLKFARCTKAAFLIDGDLQDPPELLTEFLQRLDQGYDVVYGVRKTRKENFIKRFCYSLFYRVLSLVSNISIPLDSGDFSLVSRRVVDVLNAMPEESRFLRGMRSWVGFKQIGIEYDRQERYAGESKYSISKLFQLALTGIFNFSELPVRFIAGLGFFAISISIIYAIHTVLKKFFFGTVPEGFTALLFMIVMLSGVQLLSIGILGEYILRIFFQSKQRPLFVVDKIIVDKNVVAVNPGIDSTPGQNQPDKE